MASSAKMLKVLSLVAMLMMVITPKGGEASISCMSVMSTVFPCYNYVMNGGDVPYKCCSGVTSLFESARTVSDRQSVCSCLKSTATGGSSINFDNIATLPGKCGINLPFKLSPDMDCSKAI